MIEPDGRAADREPGEGSEQDETRPEAQPPRRRRYRRAVRPGNGPEPLVDRRRYEAGGDSPGSIDDDERLRRDVPPHWS
ncbi:hypothetical protein [Ruania halotolerans]|uniref:hypothetical protein n=1 Tax=Ruania halotolerans TaxID=2897773 RepID=UPI001E2ACBD4|nr:hypothetical protein [Ruania halotolerans]UFU07301.1 hypothetical protein LQF10_04100 [Ruania halotolerans]